MAIELTGLVTVHTSTSQDTSVAYTIPADATAVVVISNGSYSTDGSPVGVDELNWDDGSALDFTLIVEQQTDSDDTYNLSAHIMTSTDGNWPGTGAQTLYISLDQALNEGQVYLIQAVKGVNTSTPIRDTDQAPNPAGTFTASLSGVVSGDISFVSRADFNGPAYVDNHTHGSGQTELDQQDYSTVLSSSSWEDGEGGPSITADSDENYDAAIAFALAQAVVGGANPKGPLGMPLHGALGGPI